MESAEKSTQGLTEDEQDMSKFDRWLNDRFGPKMMNVIGVISSVLGFGLALFPVYVASVVAYRPCDGRQSSKNFILFSREL